MAAILAASFRSVARVSVVAKSILGIVDAAIGLLVAAIYGAFYPVTAGGNWSRHAFAQDTSFGSIAPKAIVTFRIGDAAALLEFDPVQIDVAAYPHEAHRVLPGGESQAARRDIAESAPTVVRD